MIVGFRDALVAGLLRGRCPFHKIPPDLKPGFSENSNDRRRRDRSGLARPPSNHFEKLRGNLAGFHSIRVNQQWRLIFRWDGERGEADGIYLDDHSYR